MSTYKRPGSPHWQIRFRLAGREIRCSSGTTDRAAADEQENELRRRYWRQIKLGERHFTWNQAVARCKEEDSEQRSWERTERAIAKLDRWLDGAPLAEITRENILKIRTVLARQETNGRPAQPSTVNRVLAVLSSILNRCVTEWGMLETAPKVPLLRLTKQEPVWATREQVHLLLSKLPPHSRDMAIFACATGMRRGEVTKMQWAHVDEKRATCYVPAANAKNGRARVVPLNADALAVLKVWREPRSKDNLPHKTHVFYFRKRAPITQVTTRAWRDACIAAGLAGFRFHDLRHTWASWQVQSGTPLQFIQEMGGWLSLAMVQRYAHLSPGHLAQYADRSLLGEAPARTETGTVENEPRKVASK
jgi:integrase